MNQEILDRLMLAKEYQKKAVYALFPEEMSAHLNVIEKEIKAMAAEVIEIWMRDEYEKGRSVGKSYESGMGSDADNVKSRNDNFQQRAGAKKIDIV